MRLTFESQPKHGRQPTCCSCRCAARHGKRAGGVAASLACTAAVGGGASQCRTVNGFAGAVLQHPRTSDLTCPGTAINRAVGRKDRRRRNGGSNAPPVLAGRHARAIQNPAAPGSSAAGHHAERRPARQARPKPWFGGGGKGAIACSICDLMTVSMLQQRQRAQCRRLATHSPRRQPA